MKRHSLNDRPARQSDRGCVVLDQPQRLGRLNVLRPVCDTAALLSVIQFLCVLVWVPVQAATQVGSAPYRAPATGAGNSHSPIFSADGRHIAFVSHANNLVTNDDLAPHLDLFVRDLVISNTALVSVSASGVGGANGNVTLYTLSSNAQFVAFETAANNLAPGDTNRFADIYARDLTSGTTRLVSVNVSGTGSGNGPSSNPLISEDGRHIVFESLASNLVTNDFNGTNDIFIHDLATGITELVSVNADGTASSTGPSHSPSISADGLTVAFVSHATNLVEGVTNTFGEVYARKVAEGTTRWAVASHIEETHARISNVIANPAQLSPYVASEPVLTHNGRFVLFKTLGSAIRFDLHLPTNSVIEFQSYTNSGLVFDVLHQFHDNPRLGGDVGRNPMSLSKDGRYAAIETATNFVAYPGNFVPPRGIRVVDFDLLITNYACRGCCIGRCETGTTYTLESRESFSTIVLTNVAPIAGRETWTRLPWLKIDPAASRLLFLSDATNIVAEVTNRTVQLYELNLVDASARLISANLSGRPGPDLGDVQPTVSPDGSLIAFESPDDSLVPDDLNRAWDVFVRNVDTGEAQAASASRSDLPEATGRAMSSIAGRQSISADGRRVAVLSLDSSLSPDDTNSLTDAIVRDVQMQTNLAVSSAFRVEQRRPTNHVIVTQVSANGRYALFSGRPINESSPFFVFEGFTNLLWRDLEADINEVVATRIYPYSPPALSTDGRMAAYAQVDATRSGSFTDQNSVSDVLIRDLRTPPGVPLLISASRNNPLATANGPSINPTFSPDTRWLVFQSLATDLTHDAGSIVGYQLYARDIDSNRIKRISYSSPEDTNAFPLSGGATNPVFSADGCFAFFEGAISNVVYRHDLRNDMNEAGTARRLNPTVCTGCINPSVSAEGRFVAYESPATPGTVHQILVRDLQRDTNELISLSIASNGGNGSSFNPLISHDARYVVFASKASDLVVNDTNRATDIFVRDRLAGVTHCASRNWLGTGTGNRVSSNPVLAANGRTVAFQSFASDLVPGDYNDTRDVFVLTLGGPDTDGDGMDDDWEVAYFSTLSRDGTGDFDNDGASDLEEFKAATNPANDASILRVISVTSAQAAPDNYQRTTVLWSATPGKTYRVQFKETIEAPWIDLAGSLTAGGTSASMTHTVSSVTPRGFYRVLLVQ